MKINKLGGLDKLRRPSSRSKIRRLVVRRALGEGFAGRLIIGTQAIRCSLGRAGIVASKREGDAGTPHGQFRLLLLLTRSDRIPGAHCAIPRRAIRAFDGWCDDPASSEYNRLIRLPFRPSHENLWLEDHLYDLLFVLDFNIQPRRKGRGSAIFFHLTAARDRPTAGCVAIAPDDMRRLIPRLARQTLVSIELPGGGRPVAKNR